MYCQNCGSEVSGKFCPNCGTPAGNAAAQVTNPTSQPVSAAIADEITLWEGQPSGVMGRAKSAAKVNADKYTITNQRVLIEHGLLSKKQEEIDFSRIKDYKVEQSLTEKVQKIGRVIIWSTDPSTPVLTLSDIEDPFKVKEILRSAVMDFRAKMNIHFREML